MSFDYKVSPGGENKKFVFDGERVYIDIDLGNMAFFNRRGADEIYKAYGIELHFPSEHYHNVQSNTKVRS